MDKILELNDKQLDILRHMLGINCPYAKIPKPYRNYAAVNPGDPEFLELEKIGAITKYLDAGQRGSRYDYYTCTESGKLAAMRSHKSIRKGKPQRVYSIFLDICDCFPDLTFKQFLTSPEFKQTRDEA